MWYIYIDNRIYPPTLSPPLGISSTWYSIMCAIWLFHLILWDHIIRCIIKLLSSNGMYCLFVEMRMMDKKNNGNLYVIHAMYWLYKVVAILITIDISWASPAYYTLKYITQTMYLLCIPVVYTRTVATDVMFFVVVVVVN